ncbi:hypothetical protein [Vibrio casei]|uniref:Uncharacterized protein n=1 Tax=Vibrio casei TaxID=673372 RepID=A0A368LHB3_9VIBR|nr:hypothetical protein [Vibrio casei]RCS70140.1 hypothetical protein CIK83_11785 [Vibrio casei]SJN24233.1 hypothetical protein FM109_05315 [Vibrio casei]
MENADMPAMPQSFAMTNEECGNAMSHLGKEDAAISSGLTKREMFAMHAMSAWIQHHGSANNYGFSVSEAAIAAVGAADSLLLELGK